MNMLICCALNKLFSTELNDNIKLFLHQEHEVCDAKLLPHCCMCFHTIDLSVAVQQLPWKLFLNTVMTLVTVWP